MLNPLYDTRETQLLDEVDNALHIDDSKGIGEFTITLNEYCLHCHAQKESIEAYEKTPTSKFLSNVIYSGAKG